MSLDLVGKDELMVSAMKDRCHFKNFQTEPGLVHNTRLAASFALVAEHERTNEVRFATWRLESNMPLSTKVVFDTLYFDDMRPT